MHLVYIQIHITNVYHYATREKYISKIQKINKCTRIQYIGSVFLIFNFGSASFQYFHWLLYHHTCNQRLDDKALI